MRAVLIFLMAVALLAMAPPAAAGDGWAWPVEGTVLTPYSNDNAQPYAGGMHRGIDIAAGVGSRVGAARAGTVTHAGVVGSSGLTVAVRTADGYHVTSYLHLAAIDVREGEAVAAGARIGAVGTSGQRSVSEPHLHFGVRLTEPAGHYVDPLSLLPALPEPPAPPAPVPAPVPVRAAPQPVPVAAPVREPRGRGARAPAAARMRPRGTIQLGPAAALRPAGAIAPVRRRGRATVAPSRVPAFGPAPRPVPAAGPRAAPRPPPAHPAPREGRGRGLVLGGLAAIALVLLGGAAWQALRRANGSVNARAAMAAGSVRDHLRIGGTVKRLLRT